MIWRSREGFVVSDYKNSDLAKRSYSRIMASGLLDQNIPSETFVKALHITLHHILDDNEKAAVDIKSTLREHRSWTDDQRWFFSQSVFGTALFRRRLRYLCGVHASQPNALLAGYWSDVIGVELTHLRAVFPSSLTEDELHQQRESLGLLPNALERLAITHSYPNWLVEMWCAQRGLSSTERLLESMNRPGPVSVRANIAECTPDALIALLTQEGINAKRGDYSPWAVQLLQRSNIWGSKAWQRGLFEVQDEGSQMIVDALGIKPSSICLDYCAGLGGKTLAMAALLGAGGRLIAADICADKLKALRGRLKKARVPPGLVDTMVVPEDEHHMWHNNDFDRILVDAPCSSLGTLRRGPDTRWHISERETQAYPALQLEILKNASRRAAPGARLLYATCTLNQCENQDVVDRFLASENEIWMPVPMGHSYAALQGATDSSSLRPFELEIDPSSGSTDGFYMALFQRR